MVKKKAKRRRSYKRKAKRRSGPKAKPVGLSAGAVLSGANAGFTPAAGTSGSLFDAAKDMNASLFMTRLPYVLKDKKNYMPVFYGVLLTASPKIPILGILAKPVDRGVKRLTKGKWGL